MRNKILIIGSIILPLVVLAGTLAHLEIARRNATPWRIAIEGYDPRDILRGHYLTFQYQWEWEKGQKGRFPEALCLNKSNHPKIPLVSDLSDKADCISILRGKDLQHGRVYIPERAAKDLEQKLQKGTDMAVDIRARHDGTIMIETLVINGEPLQSYLQSTGENP